MELRRYYLVRILDEDEFTGWMGRSDERRRSSGMVELKSSRTGGGLAGYRGYDSFRTGIKGIPHRTERQLAGDPFGRRADCPLLDEQHLRGVRFSIAPDRGLLLRR